MDEEGIATSSYRCSKQSWGGQISTGANNLLTPLVGTFDGIGQLISSKMGGIGDTIKGIFGGISTSMNSMSLGWGVIIAAVVMLVTVIVQNWDAIKTAIGTAAEWINSNVIQPVVGFFTELWEGITDIVSGIWDGVVAVVSGAAQWFYDNVAAPVAGVFSGLRDGFKEAAVSAWEGVKSVFSTMYSAAHGERS